MTKLHTIALAAFLLFTKDSSGQAFVAPNIGKFRQCDFESQCADTTSCSDIKSCYKFSASQVTCSSTLKATRLLGIRTSIPQLKCKQAASNRATECERNRSSEIAKCEERKIVSHNACIKSASDQKQDCMKLRDAEIVAGQELLGVVQRAKDYLQVFPSEPRRVTYKVADTDVPKVRSSVTVDIKLIRTRDFSELWSVFYSRSKYPDWKLIPHLGDSGYREFVVIDNFLVLSPEFEGDPNQQILVYAAVMSRLANELKLDGITQLFSREPGYVEQYVADIVSRNLSL